MSYKFDEKKHAHTYNDIPLMGTTTLIGKVLPPPLSWYGSGKALELMGWTNPRKIKKEEGVKKVSEPLEKIKEMEQEEFYKFLQKCYRNHDEYKKSKGDWGTKVHEKIEETVKKAIENDGKISGKVKCDKDIKGAIEEFIKWGKDKKFLHSEAHVYSEKLWVGGIVDIVYEENGNKFLGDIKTSKSIYSSHIIQMGLYDYQQKENGYFTDEGENIGEPLDFKGYTIVNLLKRGGSNIKTYYATKEMREFGENLVKLYKRKQKVEEFIKQ